MPSAGFEPAIPATKPLHPYAFELQDHRDLLYYVTTERDLQPFVLLVIIKIKRTILLLHQSCSLEYAH
jgi:hypothetical protein